MLAVVEVITLCMIVFAISQLAYLCCRLVGTVAGPNCCERVKRRRSRDRRNRRQDNAVQVRWRQGNKRRRLRLEFAVQLARNSRAGNETAQI